MKFFKKSLLLTATLLSFSALSTGDGPGANDLNPSKISFDSRGIPKSDGYSINGNNRINEFKKEYLSSFEVLSGYDSFEDHIIVLSYGMIPATDFEGIISLLAQRSQVLTERANIWYNEEGRQVRTDLSSTREPELYQENKRLRELVNGHTAELKKKIDSISSYLPKTSVKLFSERVDFRDTGRRSKANFETNVEINELTNCSLMGPERYRKANSTPRYRDGDYENQKITIKCERKPITKAPLTVFKSEYRARYKCKLAFRKFSFEGKMGFYRDCDYIEGSDRFLLEHVEFTRQEEIRKILNSL